MNSTAIDDDITAIVDGFSLTNRMLLYASMMLTPAQFVAGIGSNVPVSLGFLAYNYWTQTKWYIAVKAGELHALSLLPVHFNLCYAITYIGGVASGNIVLGVLLGLGTAGVMILNTVAAWTAWATGQTQGFGVYQFFFFGWRTLDQGWHTFLLLWQIGDTFAAVGGLSAAIGVAVYAAFYEKEHGALPWFLRYPAIPAGAAAVALIFWPVVLWTELIVARNNIVSETDMIAVYLFIVQVILMLLPSCSPLLVMFKRK